MFELKSSYKPSGDQPEAIKKLKEGFDKGYQKQTLLGVTGSGKTYTMASLIEKLNKPVLVIAPNKALAAQLYKEYKNFFPSNSVNYFVSYYDYYQPEAYMPITDTYIGKEAMINSEIEKLRHQATSALLTRKDVIIVSSVSCIYNLGAPETYLSTSLYLEKGKPITRGDLMRQLVKLKFERTNQEIKRGQFRVRGNVFEIKQASEDIVHKIALEDQKVESISSADSLIIFPSTHFVSQLPQTKQAIKEIRKELNERLAYFKERGLDLEAERLKRRTIYDLEMIESIGYCHGVENYSRHLTGKLAGQPPESLLSYFPNKDFLTIIDESHIAIPQIAGMYYGDKSRKEVLIKYGWRLPSALDNRPLKFEEFKERIGSTVFTSATPGDWELKNSDQIVEQIIRPTGLVDPPVEVRPVYQNNKTQIDDLIKELEEIDKKKERALVVTLTKKMAENLNDFLAKKGFSAKYIHSEIKTLERAKILTQFRRGDFNILIGVNLLREGLDFPEVTLVAILDADREGFLRNEISLIQTMGRAARNIDGKVILYADKETESIKKALAIINKRRRKQLEYNEKHKITPETIVKKIEDLI